jgi:tRNA modification GTPase
VAGDVNAGKSSLVNALAGHCRSIVSAEPGTTRDVLETRLVLDGWEIDLVDTAGLRGDPGDEPAGPTEAAGIARARDAVAAADLVVHVVDARDGRQAEAGPPSSMLVLSKCDLASHDGDAPPDAIRTSAVTGFGIDVLAAAIIRRLVPEEHDEPDLLLGAVPFTQQQVNGIA